MTSKTISVTQDVYNLLKSMKLPHESFGDTIERLCKNFTAKNLIEWFEKSEGWEDMTEEEFNDFNTTIRKFQTNLKPNRDE